MMENTSFRPPVDPATPLGRGARESVIDEECHFDGTFRTPGNMRIEGTYQGVIECHGTLFIAESGKVNARIVAGSLVVAGQLSGEAQCESRFELLRSGRVDGGIGAKSTVVHDGAFFEGEIRMGGPIAASTARAASPSAREPALAAAPTASASAPSRRRAAEEPAQAEEESAVTAEAPAPRSNGRSQSAGRDVLPNRTGEA